jgi:hypothetical protein
MKPVIYSVSIEAGPNRRMSISTFVQGVGDFKFGVQRRPQLLADEETHQRLSQITIYLLQELLSHQVVNIEKIIIRYMMQEASLISPKESIWLLGIDDIVYNHSSEPQFSILDIPINLIIHRELITPSLYPPVTPQI